MTLLTDLQDSQDAEVALYVSLKRTGLSDSERVTIIQQINDQTVVRTNAYAALANAYVGRIEESDILSKAAEQQLETLQLLEKQLNKSKSELADEKLETLKMIEITSYAGQQYQAYAGILAKVAAIFILYIGSNLLVPKLIQRGIPFAEWLPRLILILGIIYIITRVYDLLMRRNDVFDEYTWIAAPKTIADLTKANTTSNNTIVDVKGFSICADSYCCGEGTEWTDSSGCVVSATIPKVTHGQELTAK